MAKQDDRPAKRVAWRVVPAWPSAAALAIPILAIPVQMAVFFFFWRRNI